ncbi:MAG: leucine-rich repeat domain-containing protein [Bacteroidetes bacterium]|nr:leucine-rich repeat domain-containing protein [Bacteroidota bacterium]
MKKYLMLILTGLLITGKVYCQKEIFFNEPSGKDKSLTIEDITRCLNGYEGDFIAIIEDDVVSIQRAAFENNTKIKGLISDKLDWIQDNAFKGCSELKLVTLNSASTIGVNGFRDCKKLTTLNIPALHNGIGPNALNGCVNLKEMTILVERPPLIANNVFDGINKKKCKVFVVSEEAKANFLERAATTGKQWDGFKFVVKKEKK